MAVDDVLHHQRQQVPLGELCPEDRRTFFALKASGPRVLVARRCIWLAGVLLILVNGCGAATPEPQQGHGVPVVPIEEPSNAGTPADATPTAASTAAAPEKAPPSPAAASTIPYPSSARDRATARALASSGLDKLQAGDAQGALRDFAAADAIIQVPTVRLFMAKAQLKLGQRAEARRTLESVVRMPSHPHEPVVFRHARDEANALLQQPGP